MWRSAIIVLASVLCFPLHAMSQAQASLTNDDVRAMVKGGLPESTIVAAIGMQPNNFDISPAALLDLKQEGAGGPVLDAMLAAKSKDSSAASSSADEAKPADPNTQMTQQMQRMGYSLPPQYAAQLSTALRQVRAMGLTGPALGMLGGSGMGAVQAPEKLPAVTLLLPEKKIPIHASTAQVAQTQMKGGANSMGVRGTSMLTTLGTQALTFAAVGAGGMFAAPAVGIATGMLGGFGHHSSAPTMTYVWALPGQSSSFVLPGPAPRLDIEFGDIVGVDPDAYEAVLVKLVQTRDNYRLIGATKEKMDSKGNQTRTGITEERVLSHNVALGRGHVQLEPIAPLGPGEYALVLHPLKPVKSAPGSMSNNDWIFYSAWDFSVAGSTGVNAGDVKRN